MDLCDRFCSHKVDLVKADGKDILAVAMALRGNAGMGLDRLS